MRTDLFIAFIVGMITGALCSLVPIIIKVFLL